ncbi:MAG: N-acetylmuramoyl-L-alanine amidase [Fimbriimonadaceae bacterium]
MQGLLSVALAAAGLQGLQPPLPVERPFVPQGRPLEGLAITIDPGHGGASHAAGYTGSARGVESRYPEQDLNLKVSVHLVNLLRMAGADVRLTRTDDGRMTLNPLEGPPTSRSEELGARVKMAAESASHLFLAVHHNSFSSPQAHGVVVLIWPTDKEGRDQPLERAFADVLREEVEAAVPHGRRFNHYLSQHPLVTFSDQPSAVIEFGFLSNPEFDRWVTTPGNTRREAVAVYKAIERFWRERRTDLEAERARLFPASALLGRAPEPTPAEALRRDLLGDGAPSERGLAEALARYAELVRRSGGWLDARVSRENGRLAVEGVCSHPRIAAFARSLAPSGADVRLGVLAPGRPMVGAWPMAAVWRNPAIASGQVDQVLLGETVWVRGTQKDGSFLLVQTPRGTFGWLRRDALEEPDDRWSAASRRVRFLADALVDDFRIPAGAELPLLREEENSAIVALPRGVRATALRKEAAVPRDVVAPSPSEGLRRLAEGAAAAALRYQGSPFLPAGRTEFGMGAAKLASLSWAAQGVRLPAAIEALARCGAPSPTEGELPLGSILVFLGETGLPETVGIGLGGRRFLIAAPPEVQVCSLDPQDPVYDGGLAESLAAVRAIP